MVLEAGRAGLPARGADHRRRACRSRTRASARPRSATAADQLHARFAEGNSDFLAFLEPVALPAGAAAGAVGQPVPAAVPRRAPQLPAHPRVAGRAQPAAPGRRRPRACTRTARRPTPDEVHRALLAGLLSHVGQKDGDTREYLGARNARFSIFPGSALSKKPPAWVMAAELVETTRLFARTVARIEPEWAEELGAHLVKRSYSEPHWSAKRGSAMARERVTLYGLPGRRRPAGAPRPHRPRPGPRAVHPPRPGRGRLADPPPHVPPQPRAARRGRRPRAPLPPARPRRRRRLARAALRRAPPGQGRVGPPLRLVVEEGEAPQPRPAHLHRRRPAHRGGRRPRRGRLPRPVGAGLARPRPLLPLRARLARRRRRRARARRRAQPAAPRRLRVARARPPRRAGHRARAVAAQGPAPRPGAGARARRGVPRRERPRRRPAAAPALAPHGPGRRRADRRPAPGTSTPCRPTCASPSGSRATTARCSARRRTSPSSSRASPATCAGPAPRPPASFERHGLTDWDFGELPRKVRHDVGGQAVEGYPALVDEGDLGRACAWSTRRPSRCAPPGGASAACCASPCRSR